MASVTKDKEDIFDMPASESEKEKALDIALASIEKQYGKGSVMRLGEVAKRFQIDAIPTGSLALDMALGIGGLPRGRIIDIHGAESSGKSTLALHVIAEAQKMGGTAAYIDVEHSLDPGYAKKIGVDVDNLYISQPDYAEQALEITEALVRSGAIDIVVIDSVAALVPRSELEGDMGDPQMGLQARLMSQALRKLTAAISRSHTCAIFINQLREKVGIVFGNPETTPGGRALKFYASVRIDLRRQESIKVGEEVRGNRVKARVIKNKVAPPFRVAEFEIMYDRGISKEGEILDIGSSLGVVKKSGAFFTYGETRLGQGRENAKTFLLQHKEIAAAIEKQIRQSAANANAPIVIEDEDEDKEEDDK